MFTGVCGSVAVRLGSASAAGFSQKVVVAVSIVSVCVRFSRKFVRSSSCLLLNPKVWSTVVVIRPAGTTQAPRTKPSTNIQAPGVPSEGSFEVRERVDRRRHIG